MRTAIATILAAAALAGCDSSVQPSAATMIGYQVDGERNRSVWLTRDGVQIHGASAQAVRVELPGWTYVGEPYCPPALALGANGEIVVTSNVIPTLWRIDPGTLAVTTHPLALDSDQDRDVGFAAVVYVPEQRGYAAYSEIQRSAWKIDASLRSASKVTVNGVERSRTANARYAGCAELGRRLGNPRID
ncbi:hypothetical protein AYO46_00615 [Betaproteobacteria bacterium SCGC AG-212-J23]|nr:hypothetical protein AYO46_00615 [Betaproteobacteria bacterium SCGC AG-212-J23]